MIIEGCHVDPRLIVFDKDGTLIDFHHMWHTWFAHFMRSLDEQVTLRPGVRKELGKTLGYDPDTDVWDTTGPLTVASTVELDTLVAGLLYRHYDLTWEQAASIVRLVEEKARSVLERQDLVRPIGDVRGFLSALRRAGITLGLATTDTRAPTEKTLKALGLTDLFAAVVCADDGISLKPAPDMALTICERVQIAPGEALMVGDTVADLSMARQAGFGWVVGVTSGAMGRDDLLAHADWVLADIHQMDLESADDE